jgi:acetyl esterase
MKRKFALNLACFPILLLMGASIVNADDTTKKQILKLFPQADTNGDGVISDEEEAALSRQVLKRYPQVDKDGDGVLSEAEKKALLRQAAKRAQKNNSNRGNSRTDKAKKKPTHANVKYGEHERQVFDIWLADSSKPTPLAIYIHGGGFSSGSKDKLKADQLSQLLESGISVAAINYRYKTIAPLPAAHHDARRALQFMRSKAGDWNIDKNKVATFGGSAGAQICMWLAFTDDMAKPDSSDPIERESTRLTCVATAGGQTSNSPEFWEKTIGPLLGESKTTASLLLPFNGERDPEKVRIAMWGAKTLEEANETAARHAAMNIVSADDPPIFMSYGSSPGSKPPTDRTKLRGWLIHHVNLGIALKEKTDALKLEAHLKYPGAKTKYESQVEFFVDKLTKKRGPDPARWEQKIKEFEASDAKKMPPKGAVLWIGGSNCRRWKDVDDHFPKHDVINRGFGGGRLSDIVYFVDRIVLPYEPKTLLVNAGGNDLSGGDSPEEVCESARALIAKVRKSLPDTRICFNGLPNPHPVAVAMGKLLEELARSEENVVFIDLASAFVDDDGNKRMEFFVKDGIHFNEEGYIVLGKLLRGKF